MRGKTGTRIILICRSSFMALRSWSRVCAAVFCALTLSFATAAHAAEADVRRIWQMLDYLAVDYAGAVKNGAVVNASEFEEMREFTKTSQTKLAALEPHPERAALVAEAQTLSAAIEAKKSPAEVAALAKSLANHLLAAYPVPSSPSAPPQMAQAATLYKAQCAACHGATGNGDGTAGLKLDPRPVAFTDKERARERSAFALYQAISQGIEGTAMPGFSTIPESDRWALAFFIGTFAHDDKEAAAGQKVWAENAAVRAQLTSLDVLSRTTEADLAKQVGEEPAAVTMAHLHAHPEAVVQNRALSFDVARQKLAQSLQSFEKGEHGLATDLALSAYLDGVEPIEPTIATRDSGLMGRIETAMGKYRSLLTSKAALPELRAQLNDIDGLFKEADALLGSSADATAAYLGSLTILVREGLEALLVVVAMIAF
ncbi:MAG: cytochrome c, partial [Burkholderiaceae bacterium]|nr:cytochrome c [Burkholderiaceae bacterium]